MDRVWLTHDQLWDLFSKFLSLTDADAISSAMAMNWEVDGVCALISTACSWTSKEELFQEFLPDSSYKR